MGRLAAVIAMTALTAACTPSAPKPAPPIVSNGALAWTALARAPSARTEVAAAAARGRIHVIGGYAADGSTVATVEVLDTATGRWEAGPDLPLAVNHAMAASVADTVYVFGGYQAGNVPSAAAFRLDAAGWRPVAAMPQPRAAGTAAVVDGAVYVAGGITTGGRLADTMLRYDPATDRWSTGPGPPTPREHLGGAGFGGRVYTVGGRTGGPSGNLAAFEAFDTRAGTWTRLPDLPTRRGGLAAAATCSGLIIAVGGEAAATFAEVEAYDVNGDGWRSLPPLPTPRHGLGVVAIGTVLYTLAGGPRPGLRVADVTEALDTVAVHECAG